MIANARARQERRGLPRSTPTAVGAGLLLFALFGLWASFRPARAQSTSSPAETTATAREAAAAFQGRCSFCHGERGQGSDVGMSLGVPDLRSPQAQRQSDAALKTILCEGKGDMPAFGKSYSDATLDALIRVIRRLDEPSLVNH